MPVFGPGPERSILSPEEDRREQRRADRQDALKAQVYRQESYAPLGGEMEAALADLARERGREAGVGASFASTVGLPGVGGDPFAGYDPARQSLLSMDAWYRVLSGLSGPVAQEMAMSDRDAFDNLQDLLEREQDDQTRAAIRANPFRQALLALTRQEDPFA